MSGHGLGRIGPRVGMDQGMGWDSGGGDPGSIPLLGCAVQVLIERGVACPSNTHVDCGCLGCGLPGCVVGIAGCPPGLAYFVDLFGNRVENYVRRLLGKTRPRKVIICMIYFLDVHGRGSWADCFLQASPRMVLLISVLCQSCVSRV